MPRKRLRQSRTGAQARLYQDVKNPPRIGTLVPWPCTEVQACRSSRNQTISRQAQQDVPLNVIRLSFPLVDVHANYQKPQRKTNFSNAIETKADI